MCEYREIIDPPPCMGVDASPPNSPRLDYTPATSTTEPDPEPNCPICQETLKDSYLVRRFSCGHLVHQNCLTVITKNCPICRKALDGEEMLCHVCYTPISSIFTKNGRVSQLCSKCFRDQLQEETERLKVSLINVYRHSIGFDRECHVIKQTHEMGVLEGNDAYNQIVAAQESYINYILDLLSRII